MWYQHAHVYGFISSFLLFVIVLNTFLIPLPYIYHIELMNSISYSRSNYNQWIKIKSYFCCFTFILNMFYWIIVYMCEVIKPKILKKYAKQIRKYKYFFWKYFLKIFLILSLIISLYSWLKIVDDTALLHKELHNYFQNEINAIQTITIESKSHVFFY